MKAARVFRERKIVGDDAFVEMVIWHAPQPVLGSTHDYKYSLVLIIGDDCALRYDNERGQGDHRHVGDREIDYDFQSLATLLADFWIDVEACLNEHRDLQRPVQ